VLRPDDTNFGKLKSKVPTSGRCRSAHLRTDVEFDANNETIKTRKAMETAFAAQP
jgi:hypothetical protein